MIKSIRLVFSISIFFLSVTSRIMTTPRMSPVLLFLESAIVSLIQTFFPNLSFTMYSI